MTADPALLGGVGLLERAVNYTLGALHAARGAELSAPTPCRAWDLRALLAHVDESLLALHEAASLGHVDLVAGGQSARDPVATVRNRASHLLGAWTNTTRPDVTVGDTGLTAAILATAGAMEVAVHGWDVARAVGRDRPLPAALAEEMLALSRLLVSDLDRPARFAAPVAVPAGAGAGDRLLAFLGRRP
jgi:uncharacterized protein (TIGR03086 family)